MSTAAETTRTAARPVSRSRAFRRSPLGRMLVKVPFWILVVVIFIYALFPFYWALRSAFMPASELFETPIKYWPSDPTLQNFRDVLNSSFFRRALLNSTIVAGSVTLISLAIGSLAAYVDGATPLQVFWKVLLPLIAPGLVTTGLLAFIAAWNEYLYAVSFIQSPAKYTVPIAITSFTAKGGNAFQVPWGQIMAATVVVTLPLIAATLILQRRILAGLTAGAVKG